MAKIRARYQLTTDYEKEIEIKDSDIQDVLDEWAQDETEGYVATQADVKLAIEELIANEYCGEFDSDGWALYDDVDIEDVEIIETYDPNAPEPEIDGQESLDL